MKKFVLLLLSSVLTIGAVACQGEVDKTSSDAPNSTNTETANSSNTAVPNSTNTGTANSSNTTATSSPDANSVKETTEDATSQTRQAQIESDNRARDERNKIAGNPDQISDDDIESQVRNALETNIPSSQLSVAAEDGAVTISGTVPGEEQLPKIDNLAKEVKGVTSVTNKATVAPAATPDAEGTGNTESGEGAGETPR